MSRPLLVFDHAVVPIALTSVRGLEVDAAVGPGELWLIEAETPEHDRALADAALGLSVPLEGAVRFRDHDWRRLPDAFRDGLRGRCGLIPRETGLMAHASMMENILAPRRYHDRTRDAALIAEAAASARRFGLPGLPTGDLRAESRLDRLRAACVRAFLGRPVLVIIESQPQGWRRELVAPLLDAVQEVRERGGAAIWSLLEDPLFEDPTVPASARFRLGGRRLAPVAR